MPLVERFPGAAALPRVGFGALPTPVEAHPALGGDVGHEALWLKRDDLSAEGYGGNKVRKLEFLLGAAETGGCKSVITFGAYGSNHVLATAVHGGALGLDVHAVLVPQPVTSYLRKNLLAGAKAGATFHLAESLPDSLRVAATLRARLVERDGVAPMVVPFGGTNALGTIGFVNAAFELADQVERGELPEPDVIYVPMGSIGTAAGLAIGLAVDGLRTRVQAVRVLPETVGDPAAVQRTVAEAVAALREVDSTFPRLALSDLALDVRGSFLGDGYAVPTPEGRAAVETAAAHGLSLETTYTGKALAALAADAAVGSLQGRTVVFWNTYNSRPVPTADISELPAQVREAAGI